VARASSPPSVRFGQQSGCRLHFLRPTTTSILRATLRPSFPL
jgi:hypothetical protein